MRATVLICFAIHASWLGRGGRGLGLLLIVVGLLPGPCLAGTASLERIKFNHPGLVADLGVGLWA